GVEWPCGRGRQSTCARQEESDGSTNPLLPGLRRTYRRSRELVKAAVFWFSVAPFLFSSLQALQNRRAPVRLLQAPRPDVFEKFVHRRKHQTGSLHVQPQTEIEVVVEKVDVPMAEHAKQGTVGVEIVSLNDSFFNLEGRGCFARDAVTAAGKNPVQNS